MFGFGLFLFCAILFLFCFVLFCFVFVLLNTWQPTPPKGWLEPACFFVCLFVCLFVVCFLFVCLFVCFKKKLESNALFHKYSVSQ